MKKKWSKIIVVCAFVVLMTVLGSVQVFARDFYMAGHYDATGNTTTTYAYSASECDRKINVSFYDTSGNFLKKVIIHTKRGEERSVHIGMGGYDIVKFESNQGLWETCKMAWTSGTGLCTEADLFITYYFRTALSKDELNVTVTMRPWDSIEFEVRHYVETYPYYNNFHRSTYSLHSTTDQKILDYYDYFSTSKKSIYGYTLRSEYRSSVSGNLCFEHLVGLYENTPSSPRCYEYDYHNTDYSEPMDSVSKYDENKHGKLDYCDSRKFWVEYFYDINEYTVTYNANGGSGAPESQIKYHGYDLTLSDAVPTRSGYTFKGWGTSSSDTSVNYEPGGTYTGNSSRTLYAIWESDAPETYTVKFNANGGSGAPSSQIKTHGVTLYLSSTRPTRSGYTFKGWSTTSSGVQAVKYSPGSAYTSNANITLYAVWQSQAATAYTVSYDANGGSGAPSSQTKYKDVTLTLSSTTPTRSGYTFKGWSTSSTASSPTYYAGGSYTANSSATLYAVWDENAPIIYTISYNANGGSGAPSSQTKTHGVTLYLSSTEPYRANYDFLGWSTSSTATSPTYYAGSAYTANASRTLYAVWEYNPATYKVYYNANGGSGAPSSQNKTYDVSLTLSYVEPTRSGYDFKGWATSSSATSATYQPGDTYTANASVTLYAVWDETNYDFSISNLTVSDSNPYKYGQVTVKVRTDSWDQVNAYSDIPVQLYYDGSLVGTQYVDFSVYGVANVTFTLNVGSGIGNKTIEARINWADHYSETRTGNNTVSTSIEVKDYNYEMSAGETSSSAGYAEGETVITSFTVRNDSEHDIIPSSRNNVLFTAYYYNGSQKVVITTQRKNNLVIPSGGANLVYFKWTVPDGLAGKTVYCECTVNADRYLNEENYSNNTVTTSSTVISFADSQTANTRYESSQPSSYRDVAEPNANTGKATWTEWDYVNGSFVLRQYGVQLSMSNLTITPSTECVTAVYENGMWTMGSGYGYGICYTPSIVRASGYTLPDSDAYTSVQRVIARLPEFNYLETSGNYRTLELSDGKYYFVENTDAAENERIHFIPLWFDDGDYTVSVTASRVWTPAGVISSTQNVSVTIDGTMYDDWYQG